MASRDDLRDNGKLTPAERKQLSVYERALQEALGDLTPLGQADDPARTTYPELWRWLTQTDVPGGRVKEPATLIVRIGPDGVNATLADRALGWSVDGKCEHLDGIFAAMEKAANDPTAARRSHNKDPKVRRRKTGN